MRNLFKTFLVGAFSVIAAGTLEMAAAQNFDAEPKFGRFELRAGFAADPFIVPVDSGGSDGSGHLPVGCDGYFNAEQPDVSLVYDAGSANLTFFVDGASDTALLVNDPNGNWFCADDSGGADGLQPAVTIENPSSGKYDVWISEHTSGVFHKVRLAITEIGPAWDAQVANSGGDLGDDSGEYARDGECDDPRFGGTLESHLGRDATDCRALAQSGGGGDALGDDSGEYARDGECDDPRFGGDLESHRGRDATDCRGLAQSSGGDALGDDSGEYALDGECDDPRFGGDFETHRGHDATDCREVAGGGQVARVPDSTTTAPRGTTLMGHGTGFFVSSRGHVVTNHHVINGCNRVVLRLLGEPPMEGEIITANEQVDLALLKTRATPAVWASLRGGRSVRQGDEVVVFGFPLTDLLSQGGNLTAGFVTALSGGPETEGGADNLSQIQISAQVAPGNSGGPLMDRSGNIVGVVVAVLSPQVVAERTGGALPQNMNFAVRSAMVRSFLETNNVDFNLAPFTDTLSVADVGERARKFTGKVECFQ